MCCIALCFGSLSHELVCVQGDSFEIVKDRNKGERGHTIFIFFFITDYNKLYVRPHMSFSQY